MSRIIRTTEKNRCTFCKRNRRSALSEQGDKKELCPSNHCEFITEITEEIEKRLKINITPSEKKKINISAKQKSTIQIVKRK